MTELKDMLPEELLNAVDTPILIHEGNRIMAKYSRPEILQEILRELKAYRATKAKAEEEAHCTPESTVGKCGPTGTAGRRYAGQVILAAGTSAESEG